MRSHGWLLTAGTKARFNSGTKARFNSGTKARRHEATKAGLLSTLLVSLITLAGCTAADRATDAISTLIKTSGTAILEQSNFDNVTADASGRIHSPHYRANLFYVQGIAIDLGMDGVEVDGQLHASGQGVGHGLSPETIKALREKGLQDDTIDVLNSLLKKAGDEATKRLSDEATKGKSDTSVE